MTPKFLREEAARFRELAEASSREASIQRLLGMAADFEAQAAAAEVAAKPEPETPSETPAAKPRTERKSAREPTTTP